jgi:hypothetical protein
MVVQGSGCRLSCWAYQCASTAPLASKIWQPAHPQLPPRRLHWVSARAQTLWKRTLSPRARQALLPSRCGRGQRIASPPTDDLSPSEFRLWQCITWSLGLQKGELLNLFSELPLGLLLSPLSIGRGIEQTPRVLLDHLFSLVCLRKLTLKRGDPPNKALYLLTSRG